MSNIHFSSRLQEIGREIKARISKLDHLGGKAVDMYDSINCLLKEAEGLCDVDGFAAFKQTYCPELGQSRTYELLAVQQGRKTLEEIRDATRLRVAKHRAKKKGDDVTEKDSVTSVTPAGLPDKVTVNGQAVDVGELGPAAQAAEALAAYKQAWLEHCLPHVQKIMASDYEHAEAHHTNTNFSVHMDHRTKEWMDAQTKKIRTRLHKNAGCDGTGAKRKAAA